MRGFLSKIKDKIKDKKDDAVDRLLNRYLNFGITLEETFGGATSIEELIEEEKPELDLEPLHGFMDDYIGMMVLGMKGYADDTTLEIEEIEEFQCKIISDCKLVNDAIEWHLNDIGGKPAGYLRIEPSRHGSFAERDAGDVPVWSSRYRIFFYGGETLEYLDTEKMGSIEYFGG